MISHYGGLALVFLLALAAAPLRADEAADLDRMSLEVDARMKSGGAHRAQFYHGLSAHTGLSVELLEVRHTRSRLGYGEFYVVHVLAAESGLAYETVLGARRAKKGWGAIARDYGVKLGPVVSAARKSVNPQSHPAGAAARTGRSADPEAAGQPPSSTAPRSTPLHPDTAAGYARPPRGQSETPAKGVARPPREGKGSPSASRPEFAGSRGGGRAQSGGPGAGGGKR